MSVPYWVARGRTYVNRFRPSDLYSLQEELLQEATRSLRLDSVLELGCGFGRMTWIINEQQKPSRYRAIDVSPDQLRVAADVAAGVDFVEADILEYETDDRFDLVFSSEVLMHIPPSGVGDLVEKTLRWSSRYVLNIDLARWDGYLAPHNWLHDYRSLYAPHRPLVIPIGNQALFMVDKEAT